MSIQYQFIRRILEQFAEELTKDISLDELPAQLQEIIKLLPAALEELAADVDAAEMRRIATVFAELFTERLAVEPPEAMALAMSIMGASTPASHPQVSEAFNQRATDFLIHAQAEYQIAETTDRTTNVIINIFFDSPDGPTRRQVTTQLPWDAVPSAVRSERIRNGTSSQTVSLFPVGG